MWDFPEETWGAPTPFEEEFARELIYRRVVLR